VARIVLISFQEARRVEHRCALCADGGVGKTVRHPPGGARNPAGVRRTAYRTVPGCRLGIQENRRCLQSDGAR
jgi:hypothetical protein